MSTRSGPIRLQPDLLPGQVHPPGAEAGGAQGLDGAVAEARFRPGSGNRTDREGKMGNKTVTFTVPGEPQGKGRPRACIRSGRVATYTPHKTASYEGLIAISAQSAMAGRPPFDGACAVDLDIRVSVPASWSQKKRALALNGQLHPAKKPDSDNVIKAIFDGMNGVIWRDDVQAVYLVARKRYSDAPGVEVRVAEIATDGDGENVEFSGAQRSGASAGTQG